MMQKYAIKSNLAPAILGIIGILFLLLITQHGIGVGVDSVTYIGGANNLLMGHGYSAYTLSDNGKNIPITRFPPLFSMVLALIGLTGIKTVVAARAINIILFGANIFLVGLLTNKINGKHVWLSILGSILYLSSTTILWIHSMAYSEPLFIFCSLLGYYLLFQYFNNQNVVFLIGSASVIALSLLTRYAGVPSIVTCIIGIIIFYKGDYVKKYQLSLLFFIISILPMTIWVFRNEYLYSDSTGRHFSFHPIGLKSFKALISVFSAWLFPLEYLSVYVRTFLLLLLGVIFIIAFYLLYKDIYRNNVVDNKFRISIPIIPSIFIIYFICYISFIFLSKSLFDAQIPIDYRMLSPLFGPFIIILLYLVSKLYSYYKYESFIKYIIWGLCILLAITYLAKGSQWALNVKKNGEGYNNIAWQNSDILRDINKIDKYRIYSNACDPVYFITGKRCYRIPAKYSPNSFKLNKNYQYEISLMRRQLNNHDTVILWIDKLSWRKYLPSEEELRKELTLKVLQKYRDGTIYTMGAKNGNLP